jgi:hypothetical protein
MGHAAAAAVAARGVALHAGTAHAVLPRAVSLHAVTEKATVQARVAAVSRPPHHPPGKPRPQPNNLPTPFDQVVRHTEVNFFPPCIDNFPSRVNNGSTVCGQPLKAPVNPDTGMPIG